MKWKKLRQLVQPSASCVSRGPQVALLDARAPSDQKRPAGYSKAGGFRRQGGPGLSGVGIDVTMGGTWGNSHFGILRFWIERKRAAQWPPFCFLWWEMAEDLGSLAATPREPPLKVMQ